jgi:hypothetical protein
MALNDLRRVSNSQIRVNDTIAMWSALTSLALGHPLRSNRCLLCGCMIGGGPCRFACLVVADLPDCNCGQVPTVTQLICGDHKTPTANDIARAVIRLSVTAHPEGAHTCRG